MSIRKAFKRGLWAVFILLFSVGMCVTRVEASDFDPAYYAGKYPDVVAAYGTDPNALYKHYLTFGANEHRFKNAQEEAEGKNAAITETTLTYVDVDLTYQQMAYYVDGVVVLTSPIVSGNINSGNGTPTGTFFIDSKIPGKYLVGPTWNVWVDRWMRFTGNVGLHDANWRSEFGGEIYKHNGSHGCVNLPSDAAKTLYDLVSVGTMVVVHY